jgi:hypothetical protein
MCWCRKTEQTPLGIDSRSADPLQRTRRWFRGCGSRLATRSPFSVRRPASHQAGYCDGTDPLCLLARDRRGKTLSAPFGANPGLIIPLPGLLPRWITISDHRGLFWDFCRSRRTRNVTQPSRLSTLGGLRRQRTPVEGDGVLSEPKVALSPRQHRQRTSRATPLANPMYEHQGQS